VRELIKYGIQQAIAAKKAQMEAEARQAGYAPDSRYGQMLAALQDKNAAQPVMPPVLPQNAPVAPRPDAQDYAAPKRAAPPQSTAHDREEAESGRRSSGPLSGLFEDGNSLVRAVVASELLGPPIALRENPLWQIRRPNEPST